MSKQTHSNIARYFANIVSPFSSTQSVHKTVEIIHEMDNGAKLLVDIANCHFMVPTLQYALQEHGLLGSFDEEFQSYLTAISDFQNERNLAIKQQCSELLEHCRQSDLKPILLKGASTLFNDVYPAIHLRHMSDIDIFFKLGDVNKAQQVLESLGYSVPDQYLGVKPSHHFPPYYRNGDACPVELHIQAVQLYYCDYLPQKKAFHKPQSLINGEHGYCQSLSPNNEVLHCFIHSQLSDRHFEYARLNLRHMDYFVRMLKHYDQQIDWGSIREAITQQKDKIALEHYLYSVNELFNTDIPLQKDLVTPKKLQENLQNCLNSSVIGQSRLKKVRNAFKNLSQVFSRRNLNEPHNATQAWDLIWRKRFNHLIYIIWKYKNLKKLSKRIQYALNQ